MNRWPRVATGLIALVLIAAGCSSPGREVGSTPGVTDTTITIGSHQPLTGSAAAGANHIAPAAKAYFEYVNDRGGVHGRKIIYAYRDDAYTPSNTVTVVRKLVEQEKVFAIFNGLGTSPHKAVVDYLNAHKVPDLFPASACACWNDPTKLPYTFGFAPSYTREGKILGHYVRQNFPGKKIAYFYQDDAFGEDGVRGLDTQIPASQVVARESYKPGYQDVAAQMQAIHQAKADVIITFSVAPYTALLRLAQQEIGNTAQLVVDFSGNDPATLSKLLSADGQGGGANPLIEGIITDAYLTPFTDTQNSWIALARKIRAVYLPAIPLDGYFVTGMAAAYTFVQALQRAGRDLSRESLIAAMERGGMAPGFGLTPFDYSRASHGGYSGVQMGTIRGNAIVLQGQPLITDSGNGPVVPYTTPPDQAPADGIP